MYVSPVYMIVFIDNNDDDDDDGDTGSDDSIPKFMSADRSRVARAP